MTTRIIGIPDANGIIRITCDGQVIEIEVQGGSSGGSASAGGGWGGGIDDPMAALVNPHVEDDRLSPGSVNDFVERFHDARADDSIIGPDTLLLRGQYELNLHDAQRLAYRLSDSAPGAKLAVSFATLPHRNDRG